MNDIPDLRGGFRGALEINYLRIDDIRIARTRSVAPTLGKNDDCSGSATGCGDWPASPAEATQSNEAVKKREMWITDFAPARQTAV